MSQPRRILWIIGLLAAAAACGRSPSKTFDQGVADFRAEKFARAAESFEKALQTGAPTAQAWNFLGVCRLQTGHPAEAIKAFEACLDLNPTHAPAQYNLALAYIESQQPEQAIPLLRHLAQAGHAPPSVHVQLGRALVTTGAWAPAKQAFLKLNEVDVTADIHNSLGVVETRLGNFKLAKAHFEAAAQLDTNLPAVYLNLATLENHYLGQKTAAVEHYQKFLEVAPKADQREDIRLAITQLTHEPPQPVEVPVGKPVEPTPPAPPPPPAKPVAAQDLPALEKIEPKPAPVPAPAPVAPPRPMVKRRTPIAVTSLKAGDRAKARAAFNEGIALQQQTKLSAAMTAYTRAIKADPTYAQAYYNLAIAHVDLRQPELALDNYELALLADPDFTNARYNYAIILQQQGFLTDAVAQYEKILLKNPKDASLHLIVASLYARDPQHRARARPHYQAVHRLTPDSPAGRDARDWLQKNP